MKVLISLLIALEIGICSVSAMSFAHPGALDSKSELDFVKARIKAGGQPWSGELSRLRNSGYATQKPHGLPTINSANNDADISRENAIAAYAQALLWYYTGEEVYARSAVAILNSWADLQAFTAGSEKDRLQAGWMGAVLAPAAEIMRLYSGWSPREIANLQAMFRRAFYPQINTASTWNGNVDLTQIDAMMGIAVFNEDAAEFEMGLARIKNRSAAYFYLSSDGPKPRRIAGDGDDLQKFWFKPSRWIDGLTQETCRDNGHHSQFGLGSALHAAEIAWHQGVDVYAENQERYTAAMELLSDQLLTGSTRGLTADDKTTLNRFDTWEIGYSHYQSRIGVSLPQTRKLILEQIRPRAVRSSCNLNFETLTHAELPNSVTRISGSKSPHN